MLGSSSKRTVTVSLVPTMMKEEIDPSCYRIVYGIPMEVGYILILSNEVFILVCFQKKKEEIGLVL